MRQENPVIALQRAHEFLSRPLRFCGIRHEDVNRQGSHELLPECHVSEKHSGCPHLFAENVVRDVLRSVRDDMPDIAEMYQEAREMATRLEQFDVEARVARTGDAAGFLVNIPSSKEGTDDASIVVSDYHKWLTTVFDPFRIRLLDKISAVLHQIEKNEV